MKGAFLGYANAFGTCYLEHGGRNFASEEHVVGIKVEIKTILREYIPKNLEAYGRTLYEHLVIKCDFHAVSSLDEEGMPFLMSLDLIQSIKPEWTKEKCLEVGNEIAKITGHEYDDEDDRERADQNGKYLLEVKEKKVNKAEMPNTHVPFVPKEF